MTALHFMLKKSSKVEHFRTFTRHGARGDLPNRQGITACQSMSRKRSPEFRSMADELARSGRTG